MKPILERTGKERLCPNCSYTLKYSWLSLINKDWIALYSKDGHAALVSTKLGSFSTNKEALEQGVLEYEKQRKFEKSYQFSIANELRCPNCNHPLTSRSNERFESIVNARFVFLDGMTFINDEKIYKVKVTVS